MNELIEYVRDRKGNRVGVVVALKTSNVVKISWSRCHKRDTFDRKRALHIARARCVVGCGPGNKLMIPRDVFKAISRMQERAKSYFKCDVEYSERSNPVETWKC